MTKRTPTPAPGSETKRCAIYTRKSTTMGLEQEFNSLDAQRESGLAYIQRQPGWKLVDERYDDGGFTGANIDRPAFTRLLADVEAGKIDVIVVYKVDRLSRSLLDFAKMMERFTAAGVSFVSVTQNFSTADAMGRLTLNMLMSFAEFERSMIAERTRDKIAASRRKGKWTGGPVPFGYSVKDKKLLVNEVEAQVVREAFTLFLGEMLTATAMGHFEEEIAKAVVLALFVPLIISSGGNSGSQATTLVIRAMALGEVRLRDWWRVVRRELFAGLVLGVVLGCIGVLRILSWQALFKTYGPHAVVIALTVGVSLVGVVTFGTLAGSMLPFILRRLGFDPASASAPFVATLVDVTGLVIYFSVARVILGGSLL